MKALYVCAALAGLATVSSADPSTKVLRNNQNGTTTPPITNGQFSNQQPVIADSAMLLMRLDALEKSNKKLTEQVADLTAQLKAQKKDTQKQLDTHLHALPFGFLTFNQLVTADAATQKKLTIPIWKGKDVGPYDVATTGTSNVDPNNSVVMKPPKIGE